MLPIIPKPAISPRQKALAMSVAGFVDLLQIAVFPAFGWGIMSPAQGALDILTVILLCAICGFKWQFIAGFMIELAPGVALFPTWTAVALTLPSQAGGPAEPAMNNGQRVSASGAHPHARRYQPVDVQARVVPPVQSPPVQNSR